jgi:MarR family transcriptional regulator, organic hydroperoxide resistance regulator
LIYRQADKVDKRSVLIFLTKAGKLNKEKSRETVLRFNEVVREEIPNKKLDVFFEVLQEINKMIERNNIYETANS